MKLISYTLFITLLSGCMPKVYPPGENLGAGLLQGNRYIAEDGTVLRVRKWLPEKGEIKAVLIALHGFNDYSHFFELPGEYFRTKGIASYAYDQRGFGESPKRGLWAGVEGYVRDLELFIQLVKQKYPQMPVYVLGNSMGGAVVIVTMAQQQPPQVSGVILSSAAVWARETMPWYQRMVLWTMSHAMPWFTLTGESAGIMPSDNIEILKAFSRDPLVIKKTRVETIYGLVNLMDAALHNANKISVNSLLLYGEKDEVIPKQPTYQFLQDFLQTHADGKTVAFYENGYHMLLRDCQAAVVWDDIIAWMDNKYPPLPSAADVRAQKLLRENHNSVMLSQVNGRR
jgi:alpha-beta hydrolase superfamily lysophospholipase